MKVRGEKNIIIAGVGGQGNILASKIVAEAARVQGMHAIVGEMFGSSQRGGSVASHVRVGDGFLGPICPERGVQVICGLEPMESLRAAIRYAQPDGLVFTNTRVHQPMSVNIGKERYPPLEKILGALQSICGEVIAFDATNLAIQAGGAVCTNLVLLGAISTVESIGISVESYLKAISASVPKFVKINIDAFNLGREEVSKREM